MLDQLFRKYVPSSKIKKLNKNNASNNEVNPKNLTFLFYFSIFGLLVECLAVQFRPGWIAIVIFLQSLYLVLIGYHSTKSVMYLEFTGFVSIVFDAASIFFFQYFEYHNIYYTNPDDKFYSILVLAQKILLVISMVLRIGILIAAYSYLEPPLQRVTFSICNKTLHLNTRLRPGTNHLVSYNAVSQ